MADRADRADRADHAGKVPGHRIHGGMQAESLRALGVDPARFIDLSVNVNPFGPSEAMREALAHVDVSSYPDPDGKGPREAIAAAIGYGPSEVLIGNGASDLLWTLAQAYAGPGKRVLMAEPTFSEFAVASAATGATVDHCRAPAQRGYVVDLNEVQHRVRSSQANVVYLCAPQSPTGAPVSCAAIAESARAMGDVIFIVDQSFLSMSAHFEDLAVRLPSNAIALRSLTKDHGVPGVRIGYLLSSAERVTQLAMLRPTWAVGAHGQAAISAAMADGCFIAASRERLLSECAALAKGLRALGLSPLPSATLYLCVDVGDAAQVSARLLHDHAILVRDCSSFGLPRHIRIAARTASERERVCAALGALPELSLR